jgi:hypothetical protein
MLAKTGNEPQEKDPAVAGSLLYREDEIETFDESRSPIESDRQAILEPVLELTKIDSTILAVGAEAALICGAVVGRLRASSLR